MKLQNKVYQYLKFFYINFSYIKYLITKYRNFKLKFLGIYIHKKLQYFIFLDNLNYKNYSAGQLIGLKGKKIKFFKKSINNITLTINILKKKLKKKLKNIFFFFCKNFNYKNYIWIKKLFYLIKPNIIYFLTTQSYRYIKKNKRRVKKKILRNLFKNTLIS